MMLLAEAYTVNKDARKALNIYEQVLDARTDNFGPTAGEPTKDIFRAMAPLHQQLENYTEAASCLNMVIKEEKEEILKVGLYTKIAGNYKKAQQEEECVKASTAALDLIKSLSGEKDP